MTASKKLIQAAAGNVAGGDFYDYTIDNSLFVGDGTKYLYHTGALASTPTDRKKLTISFWFKQCNFQSNTSAQNYFYLGMSTGYPTVGIYGYNTSADQLEIVNYQPTGTRYLMHTDTDMAFRDVSAWYHLVLVVDTTLSTATDRYIIYVNGSEITHTWRNQSSNTPQNAEFHYFNLAKYAIGAYVNPNTAAYDPRGNGYYIAEYHAVDGTAYAPTDFGEFKNGVWIPKETSGISYGNGGFYLDFADSSDLGKDVSGNANHFTGSSITASDQMTDTPTNNFATLNPLSAKPGLNVLFEEGNLQSGHTSGSWGQSRGNMAVNSGKWYFEARPSAVGSLMVGVQKSNNRYDSTYGGDGFHGWYAANGSLYYEGSVVTTYSTYTSGDIISVYLNMDDGEVSFYKNGTLAGTRTTIVTGEYYEAVLLLADSSTTAINFGQNGTFNGAITAGGNSDANGIGDFKYTVPTGALALCTANLPEPTIGPNSATQSDENFAPVLYTGNGTAIGSGGKTISDLEFQPDFTWIKNRDATDNHMLFDAVRTATKYLSSNSTNAEATDTESLTSFTSTGFTLGNNVAVNTNAEDYVAWNWKANGSGSSNTDGDITSTVSANTDAGISIVTYTGSSSGISVGHGLSSAPEMIIWKARGTPNGSARSWIVWTKDLTSTNYILYLNLTNAETSVTAGSVLASSPTATTFSLGTEPSVNWNAENYVAYCFHSVEGFSKFGKYTGNGNSDGTFVYTGFRPAFVLVKSSTYTGTLWLTSADPNGYNVVDTYLAADSSNAEYSPYTWIDYLSNGFKLRQTGDSLNRSGQTYIFMAFAEMPFRYSNAR